MNSLIKKCIFVAFSLLASLPAAFAQDVDWSEVPFIDVKDVKHDLVSGSGSEGGYAGMWARTTVELQAKVPTWSQNFKPQNWLNNVKVTLTLAYPKTTTSLSGKRARGSKSDKEKAIETAEETSSADSSARFTYYRASVTLVGLEIGAGRASAVSFFIPAEIVARESKLSQAMTGKARPEFYLVEFECDGREVPVCNTLGNLLSSKALRFYGTPPKNMKKAADFVQWAQDNSSSAISQTRGLLIPYTKMPFSTWPKNAPAVIFEDIQQ